MTNLGHLGTTESGNPIDVDLDRLIGSHALAIANTGGGKSGLVRRLLETTHGRVPQIVLDPEDELYTLRERYDYVIAGGDGADCPATVAGAADLAQLALQHRFSLIVQMNDLGAAAPEFVARFLEGLMCAPRELWGPTLIAIDELQRFAPSGGAGASSAAVEDLVFRGRKRGFTLIGASLRITKIDANVRGMVNNWMLGRVGQTLDRNTMADQLGFSQKEGRDRLRAIEERHFWGFGPAIAAEPVLFRVADVETTPVRPGQAKVATPPAPEALRAILQGLAEMTQSESESQESGRREIGSAPSAELIAARARLAQFEADAERADRERSLIIGGINAAIGDLEKLRDRVDRGSHQSAPQRAKAHHDDAASPAADALEAEGAASADNPVAPAVRVTQATGAAPDREYRSLAVLAAIWPAGLSEAAWAARAGRARKGGAWIRQRKRYSDASLIEQRDGRWFATEAGVDAAGAEIPDMPSPGPALVAWWAGRLGAAGRLLKILQAKGALKRDALAAEANMSPKGGAFIRYVAALKNAELAEEQGKRIQLARALTEVGHA